MNFGWTFSSPSRVHSFGAFGSSPTAVPPRAAVPTATAPAAAALIAERRLTFAILPLLRRTRVEHASLGPATSGRARLNGQHIPHLTLNRNGSARRTPRSPAGSRGRIRDALKA